MGKNNIVWLPELEGLRGAAAVWVFLGHICILTQFHVPILSAPKYGVDLFIILSGFLMTKNYFERKIVEPWDKLITASNFLIRRFFRIAPLYYVLLFFAIAFGPQLGHMRDIIGFFYPDTITDTVRYSDQSLLNIFMHISFLFGVSPAYSFRTVLPDWSIGLEMQYYILFPLIMYLCTKSKVSVVLIFISVASTLSYFIFSDFIWRLKCHHLSFLNFPCL